MGEILTVRTLGTFSVARNGVPVSEASARSRKVWNIFKYLITNRHRITPVESLIDMLWEDGGPEDPLKSLYTLISRLRKQLGHDGGTEFILFRPGGYQWNTDAPVEFDAAVFEDLITQARNTADDGERLTLLREAIGLYAGDYLAESSAELWVQPVQGHYKRLYLRAVNQLADLYAARSSQEEIISLCGGALKIEPYDEGLYERLIQALLFCGDIAQAKREYRNIADRIHKEFGATPGDGLQALHREIAGDDGTADIQAIRNRLDRGKHQNSVLFCSWDAFGKIYQLDRRSSERIQFPVYMALVTAAGTAAAVKSAMRTLRQCFAATMRQGDVAAQYSQNQYMLLLTAYREQDANNALDRVKRLFAEQSKGEPVTLTITLSGPSKTR
jgi:DNA-binding SARP family transcriptional activator